MAKTGKPLYRTLAWPTKADRAAGVIGIGLVVALGLLRIILIPNRSADATDASLDWLFVPWHDALLAVIIIAIVIIGMKVGARNEPPQPERYRLLEIFPDHFVLQPGKVRVDWKDLGPVDAFAQPMARETRYGHGGLAYVVVPTSQGSFTFPLGTGYGDTLPLDRLENVLALCRFTRLLKPVDTAPYAAFKATEVRRFLPPQGPLDSPS